jgi:hypothetical protein
VVQGLGRQPDRPGSSLRRISQQESWPSSTTPPEAVATPVRSWRPYARVPEQPGQGIGGGDPRMERRPEAAPGGIEEEVTAHRALPGEHRFHPEGVRAHQHVAVQEISMYQAGEGAGEGTCLLHRGVLQEPPVVTHRDGIGPSGCGRAHLPDFRHGQVWAAEGHGHPVGLVPGHLPPEADHQFFAARPVGPRR